MVIGITGPTGAGKSTVSKAIAAKLGIVYVDTGALYRTVGYYVRSMNTDPKDAEAVAALLPDINIEVKYIDIRKYQIKLIKHTNTILKDKKNNDIIKKSVTFEYKWSNNWTFSANIEQIKYSINKYFKLYLESEVNNENN